MRNAPIGSLSASSWTMVPGAGSAEPMSETLLGSGVEGKAAEGAVDVEAVLEEERGVGGSEGGGEEGGRDGGMSGVFLVVSTMWS